MVRHFRLQIFYGVITLLVILVAFSYSTYAWFSLTPDTNVEPMQGSIGHGGGNLQIAAARDGEFDVSCPLQPIGGEVELRPVSTADLTAFYTAVLQDKQGVSVSFEDCTDRVDQRVLHGFVYLRSLDADAVVYLEPTGLSFGQDAQALAAVRLGLRVTTQAGTSTHIIKLDSLVSGKMESKLTVAKADSVVSGTEQSGAPRLADDPAVELNAYCASSLGGDTYAPGERSLCTLTVGEVAEVEYWLYLEGCDENCFDPVQAQNAALQLAFAGVSAEN